MAELRARTERLYPFASTSDVDAVLDAMERHDPPIVALLDRQPGEREARWVQLVADEAVPLEMRAAAVSSGVSSSSARTDRVAELEARLNALEERVAQLEALL